MQAQKTKVPFNQSAIEPLLSRSDLSAILGVTVQSLKNWQKDNILPPPIMLNSRPRWRPATINKWLNDLQLPSPTKSK